MAYAAITLVGRYPTLLHYLRQLLQHAFPAAQIRCTSDPYSDYPDTRSEAHLLVMVHDRNSPLPIEGLQELVIGGGRGQGVSPWLLLSEVPEQIAHRLPADAVLRDLSLEPAELTALVQALGRGERPRCHPLQARNIELGSLTRRERQVLHYLRDGVSNKCIAKQLSVSESTIKFHVSKLFAKTGSETRIHMALRAGQLLAAAGAGKPVPRTRLERARADRHREVIKTELSMPG